MDIYHIWFDLKDGVRDLDFTDSARAYFEHLKTDQRLAAWRITRRKLGLGHPNLPPWHITLEFENLGQMDDAFLHVATRNDPVETFHHAVNSKVTGIFFALYRDFPDAGRQRGHERF